MRETARRGIPPACLGSSFGFPCGIAGRLSALLALIAKLRFSKALVTHRLHYRAIDSAATRIREPATLTKI